MPDRSAYLKYLLYPPEAITPSQFSNWKQHAVTKDLFKFLITELFDEIDAPLPEDFEKTIVTVHQREGSLKMMDNLMSWVPKSVKDAWDKSRLEGKAVEGDDEN